MIQFINTVSAFLTSNLMGIIIILIKRLCLLRFVCVMNAHEEIQLSRISKFLSDCKKSCVVIYPEMRVTDNQY